MKRRIAISVLLGGFLVGLIALGPAGTNAQSDARVVKDDARSPQAEKVEADRDLPMPESVVPMDGTLTTEEEAPEVYQAFREHLAVQESVVPMNGTLTTEEEAPEVFQAFREHLAGGERPARRPSVQAVQTAGGTLAILDRGDGVLRLTAFTIDRENPNGEDAQGIAFSAVITKEGIEVSGVDVDHLAKFVGTSDPRSEAIGSEGGVATPANDGVVIGPCTSTGGGTCCIVATDTLFCWCCVSPTGSPKCMCTPLA